MILGIDPGFSGALAFINKDKHTVRIYDMPVYKERVNKKNKLRTDADKINELLQEHQPAKCYLELVWTTPQMGVASAGSFMEHKGTLLGCLSAQGIECDQILPKTWQKGMKCPADARKSVARAVQLFPDCEAKFFGPRGGPKADRAEALMIGMFGAIRDGFVPTKRMRLCV